MFFACMLFDCFCLCFEALKKSCSCLEELFAFGWPPFDPCRYESLRNPSAIPWDRKYIKDSISRYYQMWRTGLNSSLNLIFFPVHSINLPLNNYSCSISHTGHKSLDHSVRRMGPLTLTYKVFFSSFIQSLIHDVTSPLSQRQHLATRF